MGAITTLEAEAPATHPQESHVRPLRARSYLAVTALALNGLLSLALIIGCSIRIALIRQMLSHARASRADLMVSDAFILWISRAHSGVSLLTYVAFLLWFFRAYQNLSAFRDEALQYSPAQAVGSFFIPFVNLLRPFQVMREIWQASDPKLPPFDPRPYTIASTSPLVPAWWVMFLLRGILGSASLLPRLTVHTLDTLLMSTQILCVDLVASIIAAGLACTLILLILRRQEDLAKQLVVFEQASVF